MRKNWCQVGFEVLKFSSSELLNLGALSEPAFAIDRVGGRRSGLVDEEDDRGTPGGEVRQKRDVFEHQVGGAPALLGAPRQDVESQEADHHEGERPDQVSRVEHRRSLPQERVRGVGPGRQHREQHHADGDRPVEGEV